MTVKEVIEALRQYPMDAMVYVPDTRDGTAQIAKSISALMHLRLMEGVSIPDDVAIVPWSKDEFEELFNRTTESGNDWT